MTHLYVCHFSNGHIKVGRSTDPESRIASHADRVSCLGVELTEHQIYRCAGSSQSAEQELIKRCAGLSSKQNKNEWFEGLDFSAVCGLAYTASQKPFDGFINDDARFIDSFGGAAKLAERLGYEKVGGVQRVQNWVIRGIPSAVKIQNGEMFRSLIYKKAA